MRHLFPKFGEAGDPIFGDPARHDAGEMGEVGRDVDGEAVERHPALHAHAEGTDLGLARPFADPDADPPRRAMGGNAEFGQCVRSSSLRGNGRSGGCRARAFRGRGPVADPLARPMIGVAAAAAGLEHREAQRVEQFGRVGAGPGGEQGADVRAARSARARCPRGRRRRAAPSRRGFLISDGRGADLAIRCRRSSMPARWRARRPLARTIARSPGSSA